MMGTVPGKGLRVPMLASGPGANRLIALCIDLPAQITVISEHTGDAATRKLLRSITMKGLAANVIEAMRAAEQAGCAEWLWNNMAEEINRADETMLFRFVSGTSTHAKRRLHEMEAAQGLLNDLGIEPLMTTATVENLRHILDQGIPHIPEKR